MFNTRIIITFGGALAGALLVFLLINWGANTIYGTGGESSADHVKPAYVIEVAEAPAPAPAPAAKPVATKTAAAKPAAKEPTVNDILAAGDAGKGAKVFSKCKACHKISDGVNAVGPFLFNVVDRDIATAAGYKYSSALAGHKGKWTPQELDKWLTKPKGFAPGTKMGFAGLKKATDRANVIAYLETISPAYSGAAPAAKKAAAAPAPTKAVEPAATAAATTPAAATPAVAGDPVKGKKVFKKCKVCHKLADGVNGIGPSLYGVVGRKVATEAGFKYSKALQGLGGDWTEARIAEFLTKPRNYAPGTKMGFSGLKKESDRQNIIAFLKSVAK